MRRTTVLTAVAAALVLLAGCTSAPATGTTAPLYDAADGKGVFVGRFGAAPPADATIDLRLVGGIVGATWCVDISVFDGEGPWFPPAATIGHLTACQLIPVVAGDATITLGPLGPAWDELVNGPLEGRWFWAQVSVHIPPETPVVLAGVRGITVAGVTTQHACRVNPGVIYVC
ncbi:hypothetical protein [Dermatobacter hominis]|uniref:hypothetical protein n=1 Tax=Dermatobacter hominis TaxID=2884263 RepID=UPI001D108FE9|nr:hypothetical protein [Dermatobacter hominis]UDY38005.1 hypothetical protein LH044_10775 [Dermatobacter hominis]